MWSKIPYESLGTSPHMYLQARNGIPVITPESQSHFNSFSLSLRSKSSLSQLQLSPSIRSADSPANINQPPPMANPGAPLLLLLLLLASTSSRVLSFDDLHTTQLFNWMPSTTRSTCQGTISDCLSNDSYSEFDLDSYSSRRILATSNYISYGALSRNRVPCSRRGASYYNCRAGAQANPYRRGCSAITRCRS